MASSFNKHELLEMVDLEAEASHELASGHWGKEDCCTYDLGALSCQNVVLCRTCSAARGAPVVVCFGCSLTCHLDHELTELWKKKNLHCDCPTSCAFNAELTERLPNDNVYEPAHNFQGLFCWCRQPYDAEKQHEIDGVVMLQCVVCTDWFHEKCLLGERGGEQELPEDEVDEGALVCRDCAPQLGPYLESLRYRADYADVSSYARPATCPEQVPIVAPPRSTFLIPTFEEYLCNCEACAAKYAGLFVESDDEDEEEEEVREEDRVVENNGSSSSSNSSVAGVDRVLNASLDGALKKLPHTQQVAMASGFSRFKEIAGRVIAAKYDSGKRVIDEDDIEEIKSALKRSKGAE
jgi:hypothetical protein